MEPLHLSYANKEFQEFQQKLVNGELKVYETPFPKFNEYYGGLLPGEVLTIAAPSGGGKSAQEIAIGRHMVENYDDVVVLTFSLEMTARSLAARHHSRKRGKTVSELLGRKGDLTQKDVEETGEINQTLRKDKIFYFTDTGTPKEIVESAEKFMDKARGKFNNPVYVLSVDHTLLMDFSSNRSERDGLVEFGKELNKLKKKKKFEDSLITIIYNQTNRSLDDKERLNNPITQFPVKSDVFGSDALYHLSDFFAVSMVPEQMGVQGYGNDGYGNYLYEGEDLKGKFFLHVLKTRNDVPRVLMMKQNFKYQKIERDE